MGDGPLMPPRRKSYGSEEQSSGRTPWETEWRLNLKACVDCVPVIRWPWNVGNSLQGLIAWSTLQIGAGGSRWFALGEQRIDGPPLTLRQERDMDGSRPEAQFDYTVTVTYKGESETLKCYFYGDPETWQRTPPGTDGVSRFIHKGAEWDETLYQLKKRVHEALRGCMAKVHKAFF